MRSAAVPVPKVEITKQRALRRQVLWEITPLASRAQHIHEGRSRFPALNGALASAAFAGGIKGRRATTHRSSDRWIRSLSRLYLGRFSDVHIGGPSSNQATP